MDEAEEFGRLVTSVIDQTRALASSLRAGERGWDWQVVDTPDGPVLDARPVSIEEAERTSTSLLLDLISLRTRLADTPGGKK